MNSSHDQADFLVEFRAVGYESAGVSIVRDLNFSLGHGQTLALLGPSGCGKTTTLRLINRLLLPTAGDVRVEGRATRDWEDVALRRRTGYVIQDGGLFPHLSGEDNVCLMARHLKQPETQIASRLKELCELTHFPADALARFPSQLSGGQRQRLGLMRALMLDPPILLLDEPLGALDPMVRSGLQNDLKDIFARLNKTVVLVTHDLAEAAYLADSIVLMRDGIVVQHGTLSDLRERPADPFVEAFLSAQRSLVAL